MVRSILQKSILFLALALVWAGCMDEPEKSKVPESSSDRKEMLTFWVESMILPGYEQFDVNLQELVVKTNDFSSNPDINKLQGLREAWEEAYVSWQKVELFEIGPAEKYTLRSFFNIYPADVQGIESNIAASDINLDLPSSYARQGFPALDYLINGAGTSDEAILAYYQDPNYGERRINYLKALVSRMKTLLSQVRSDWSVPYIDGFVNKTGLDIGSSTAAMVNSFVLYYERHIRSGKFGIPSGATIASEGVPNPEKVEAYYKRDISLLLAKTAQKAVEDFFNGIGIGKQGPSLKSYLIALGAKDPTTGKLLTDSINEQFQVINALLEQLSPSFIDQIQSDNQAMIDVYIEMQKMVRILKVDMSSAMSITITYTDNDGD